MTSTDTGRVPTFTGAFRENLDAMISLMLEGHKDPAGKKIGFELERVPLDAAGRPLPFSGPGGVAELLGALAQGRPAEELVMIDGHLLGLDFSVEVDGEPVAVTVSLEPAAQLEVSAGPAHTVRALYGAVKLVDAQIERALAAIGQEGARLVAAGYDPAVADPRELELIPKDRYRDMDAYLSRRGRFARDMMRCSASTQVSLDYEDEADAQRIVRMATLLGPLFAFLFDNAPTFRGAPSPGMARSRIWHHVDVDRCGIVPGSLEGLSFEDYVLWVSNVKPILFTDAAHVTRATGDAYTRDIMSARALEKPELMHLLSMVFPNVRLKGFCELREMDSLPPRLAAACTSFTGALLYDRCLEAKLAERLGAWLPRGFDEMDENDCVAARLHLEERGWDAEVYGAPAMTVVEALVAIATENVACGCGCTGVGADGAAGTVVPVVREGDRAANDFDLEGIELLARLWAERKLPRDIAPEELAKLG